MCPRPGRRNETPAARLRREAARALVGPCMTYLLDLPKHSVSSIMWTWHSVSLSALPQVLLHKESSGHRVRM